LGSYHFNYWDTNLINIVSSLDEKSPLTIMSETTLTYTYDGDDNDHMDYNKTDKLRLNTDDDDYGSEIDVKVSSSFLEPGSINSSVLNLIAATMGAGTITMPYIICVAGIGLGSLLTIIGAFLSQYTGMLLVSSTYFEGLSVIYL